MLPRSIRKGRRFVLMGVLIFLQGLFLFAIPVWADAPRLKDIEPLLQRVLLFVWGLAGLAFFGMLVWGGVKWLMSTGDPQKAAEAQQTLVWAVIGLVALLCATVIFGLVIGNVVGWENWDKFRIFTDVTSF